MARPVRVEALVRLRSVEEAGEDGKPNQQQEMLDDLAWRQRPTENWERKGSSTNRKRRKGKNTKFTKKAGKRTSKKHWCRFVAWNDRSLKEAENCSQLLARQKQTLKRAISWKLFYAQTEAPNTATKPTTK